MRSTSSVRDQLNSHDHDRNINNRVKTRRSQAARIDASAVYLVNPFTVSLKWHYRQKADELECLMEVRLGFVDYTLGRGHLSLLPSHSHRPQANDTLPFHLFACMSAVIDQNNAVLTAGGNINSDNTILETHIHPPAQPPAPLPPLRRCPLPSSRFTGRKAELDKMARFFFRKELKKRVFSIIGIGGCGKSQLAFHFVHYHVLEKLKFDPSMVFFVDATTTATLEESWKAIAESRGIGDTSKAALDWLSNSPTASFTLVDNADDPNISLRDYLPRSTKSYVLITSRLARARSYGSEKDSFIVLQALLEEDAEELLIATAEPEETDRLSVKELLGELHYHALAVVQAGAGIRVLHLPVQEYIRLFRQHRTALMDGQKDGVKDHDLDDYRWTVQSAYRISVSHLSEGSSARRLLGLLGHLHHTGVKEEFFRRAFEEIKSYEPFVPFSQEEEKSALSLLRELLFTFSAADGSWDSLAFKRAMSELISLSLVTYDEANGYQIHPLICDALRYDFSDPLLAAFLLTLAYRVDMYDAVFNHHLSPHAEKMLASLDQAELHPVLASGLGQICVHLDQGRRSESLLKMAMHRCQREAGEDALSTLICMAALSYILNTAGRHTDSLELDRQMLEKCTSLCGPDHPDTIRVMDSLAATLYSLGRSSEAQQLQEQVLEKRTLLLGPDHPQTVNAMRNLALILHSLGCYDEAERMEKQVLEKRTLLLGPDHPQTVDATNDLAITLHSLGRYEEAERMKNHVLEERRLVLGSAHPDVGKAMAYLSYTVRNLGRKKEAEDLMDEAVALLGRTLGENHPDTVYYRNESAQWREEDNDNSTSKPRASSEVESDQTRATTLPSSSSPSRSATPLTAQRLPSWCEARSPTSNSSDTPPLVALPRSSPSKSIFKGLFHRIRHSTRLRRANKEDEVP